MDGGNQVLGVDRFGEEVVAAQAHGMELFADILFRGQVNDGHAVKPVLLADHPGDFHAGAAWHVHVQDDDLGRELFQGMNDLHRVSDDVGNHACLFQHRFHVFGLGPGVIQNQYLVGLDRIAVGVGFNLLD